jgi:hypothetical protein
LEENWRRIRGDLKENWQKNSRLGTLFFFSDFSSIFFKGLNTRLRSAIALAKEVSYPPSI